MQLDDDCYYNDSLHTPKFIADDYYQCTGCGSDFTEEEYQQYMKENH